MIEDKILNPFILDDEEEASTETGESTPEGE